jgi:hypothetical protein
VIESDGTQTIGDTLLTLIFRMGLGAFHFLFTYEGSQYSIYDNLLPVAPQNTEDTQPSIVDAVLTLIPMMAQGGYYNLF